MNSQDLNEQLLKVSKKFNKACNQIKLIKQEMGRCVALLNYCDAPTNIQEINSRFDDVDDDEFLFSRGGANYALFKQHLSFKLESLKNVQSAYFVYAHQKADEITRLQCEIYGEEAVREAYDLAPPEVLVPVENPPSQVNNLEENLETVVNEEEEGSESSGEELTNWPSADYWSNWGLNESSDEEARLNQNTNNNRSNSMHLVEYDFLTA